MKVLVLSDVHGDVQTFNAICDYEAADYVISLGDSELAPTELSCVDSLIHGNAYLDVGRPLEVSTLNGLKIVMTHGHHEHVQKSDDRLIQLLLTHQAHLVMHGHTHVPRFIAHPNGYILNPGAIYGPRGGHPASYALLDISKNRFTVVFKTLNHHEFKREEGVFT